MRFIPKTSEELEAERPAFEPWPVGEYDFEIVKAEDTVSKSSGREMLALNIKIFNSDGEYRFVNDYIVDNATWKLHQLARAVGLDAEYDSGNIEAYMLENKVGRAKIKIKPAQGDFPAGNQVGEYVSAAGKPVKNVSAHSTAKANGFQPQPADLDDEIPF